MPIHGQLSQLIEVLAATPINIDENGRFAQVLGISTDTREPLEGKVFVALKGESFDGHQFVEDALKKGAIAAITDHRIPEKVPHLCVKNTLEAYQQLGHWWREQLQIPVIAVTGSFGKTTTKELISAVLATQGRVLKTQANYNNEIGVPKTLLGLQEHHQYAVVEMAMRGPGEIALLTQIARPTIAVITNVGTAHIGRLGSIEAIAQAKCELLAEMSGKETAILNFDNPLLIETAQKVWQGRTMTYGLTGGDWQGELINPQTLRVRGVDLPIPLPGRHNATNYLAAIAVADELGIDWRKLADGLQVEMPSGRAKRLDLPQDIVILDETYNAGLESMVAALHLLAETPGHRKIAVLGTMKELGDRSAALHQKVGQTVQQLNLDHLLVLVDDPQAQEIANAVTTIPTECYQTHGEMVDRLKNLLQPGDRVLVKASHSVALDRVVDQLRP